ncbi:MAG: hypothetical protein ACRDG4_06015 [Chloroflexota bacterium]
MMQPKDSSTQLPRLPPDDQLPGLPDEELNVLVSTQRATLTESEGAFARARERLDRDRKVLRGLLDEQERRRLAASGEVPAPVGQRARRKRSTTGMDALLGRDGVDPEATFDHFHFLSLQRQAILLAEDGNPNHQVLAFVDRENGSLREARTFGEGRRLSEAGHQLGRPGIPLQRQTIWYIGESRPGRLRLDQMFVEQEGD